MTTEKNATALIASMNWFCQDGVQLICGDCADFIQTLEFDGIVTDPPYGVAHNKQSATKRYKIRTEIQGDETPPDVKWMADYPSVIWGGNNFDLPRSTGWLVWDKTHGAKCQHSQAEIAWSNVVKTVRLHREAYHGFMRQRDGWFHPTQKPVQLYKWILNNYAKEGDKILDTHFGSLSIGVACWDLGFDLTAYELDEDYFKAGAQRLETHKEQGQFNFA